MQKNELQKLKNWSGFRGIQSLLNRYTTETTEFDLRHPPVGDPEVTQSASIFLVFDHAGPKGFLTKTKQKKFITFCSGSGDLINTIEL